MTPCPEDRLLLLASRSTFDDAQLAELATTAGGEVDWTYVLEASIRHAVAPLLWHALDEAGRCGHPVDVPPAVGVELEAIARGNGLRSRRLLGVVADVARDLGAAGVPVMALKDVQLVPEVYPDVGLRPMGDVDLLVAEDDFPRAAERLRGLGFAALPDDERPVTRRYGAGQQFRRAEDETWIDLQWHVAELEWDRYGDAPTSFPTSTLWDHAQPLHVDGWELLAPSPVDMLAHLCVHLQGHRYCELVLFTDLLELLRHHGSSFDWGWFVDRSRELGATSAVHHVLLIARRIVGLDVPEDVLRQLAPGWFEATAHPAIFGGLTSLHQSLDELLHLGAPSGALRNGERLVRTQAVAASRSFAAIDDLAAALTPVFVRAQAAPRRFPDPHVAPFGAVDLAVEATTTGLDIADALAGLGYVRADGGMTWNACRALAARDPIVPEAEQLVVTVAVGTDPTALLRPGDPAPTNRAAAIESLQTRLRRRGVAPLHLEVTIHVVDRATLVASAAAAVGAAEVDRLFELTAALSLVEGLGGVVDATAVLEVGRRCGRAGDVAVGLALLAGVSDRVRGDVAPVPPAATRVLEWARYGPDDMDRWSELRDAYLGALAALTADGPDRLSFVGAGLRRGGTFRRAIPIGVRAVLGRRDGDATVQSPRALAFWLEPVGRDGWSEEQVG